MGDAALPHGNGALMPNSRKPLARIAMDARCTNPVIFWDELDRSVAVVKNPGPAGASDQGERL